jgi:hypothetical protein
VGVARRLLARHGGPRHGRQARLRRRTGHKYEVRGILTLHVGSACLSSAVRSRGLGAQGPHHHVPPRAAEATRRPGGRPPLGRTRLNLRARRTARRVGLASCAARCEGVPALHRSRPGGAVPDRRAIP